MVRLLRCRVRRILTSIFSLAMCLGLFVVTCPLARAQPAAAQPASSCCATSAVDQLCGGCEMEQGHEPGPASCCVSHGCGYVISSPTAPVSMMPYNAAIETLFYGAASADSRAEAPPVPPPRVA